MQKLRLIFLFCVLIYANQSLAIWSILNGRISSNKPTWCIQCLDIVLIDGAVILRISFQNPFFRMLFQQALGMEAPVNNSYAIAVELSGELLSAALAWIRLKEPSLYLFLLDVL